MKIAIAISALLILVSLPAKAQINVQTAPEALAPAVQKAALDPVSGVVGAYPMCGSILLHDQEQALLQYLARHPEASLPSVKKTDAWGFTVGSTHAWYAYDYSTTSQYSTNSTCRGVGVHCYIFVEDSMWTTGKVNQTVVDSVMYAFDNAVPANPSKGVYQTDVDAFGNPPDVDNDPRIIILILNIRDGWTGSGGYIEGYFYSLNELNVAMSNQAEIYFLDAYPTNLRSSAGLESGMSTTAHEFQHMIHWNYNKSQISFVNEGCSLIAEVNCGYPIYSQYYYANEPNHYLLDWRSNDINKTLYDYSRAARFFNYLREQFTMSIFAPIVQNSGRTGIASINWGLQQVSSTRSFTDVYLDWEIANTLDDRTVDPRYGYIYTGLDKPVADTHVNPNIEGQTGWIQPLGASYLSFTGGSNLALTVSASSPNIVAKIVEIGTPSTVGQLSPGVMFAEPNFGTTYKTVTVALMDTSTTDSEQVSIAATGSAPAAITLAYENAEPTGFLALERGDTVAVVFDGVSGAHIDSVRVALRRALPITGGVWSYGSATHVLGPALCPPITATGLLNPAVPYPVPWTNWVTVDLRAYNIDATNKFAVGFAYAGDSITQQRVMVSPQPTANGVHSFTLYNEVEPPAWYYLTSNSAADSAWAYLIRAYLSFGSVASTLTVYPGDANNDGVVDVRDILPLGQYYGKTGPTRAGASLTWGAQSVTLGWSPEAAAYADCNGDGVVNATDLTAIVQNWSSTRTSPKAGNVDTKAVCQELLDAIDAQSPSTGLKEMRQALVEYMTRDLGVSFAYALDQNYPNPFNPSTTLQFAVPVRTDIVRLVIYSVLGEKVWEQQLTGVGAGRYKVVWDGNDAAGQKVSSGVYFCRMTAGSFRAVRQLLLEK